MTNFEAIKNADTPEGIVELLACPAEKHGMCCHEYHPDRWKKITCRECTLEWLSEPVEEED